MDTDTVPHDVLILTEGHAYRVSVTDSVFITEYSSPRMDRNLDYVSGKRALRFTVRKPNGAFVCSFFPQSEPTGIDRFAIMPEPNGGHSLDVDTSLSDPV